LGHLRFFFDWGAGGCLWAGDDLTRETLGYGPVDADCFDTNGELSRSSPLHLPPEIKKLIADLDIENDTWLNADYQPDPSLWRQDQCEKFNAKIDKLLKILTKELGSIYDIADEQTRYSEDPDLDVYLKDPKNFKRG